MQIISGMGISNDKKRFHSNIHLNCSYSLIYAAMYDANTDKWTTLENIDAATGEDARETKIVFDANGNAFSVFIQSDGSYKRGYGNRYE